MSGFFEISAISEIEEISELLEIIFEISEISETFEISEMLDPGEEKRAEGPTFLKVLKFLKCFVPFRPPLLF